MCPGNNYVVQLKPETQGIVEIRQESKWVQAVGFNVVSGGEALKVFD